MSAERTIKRWSHESDDRVTGLDNLQMVLDLGAAVAKKGRVSEGLLNGHMTMTTFIGSYEGNRYRVKYTNIGKIASSETLDITGVDMGIDIYHVSLGLPPFLITVDYYFGQRDVRDVLEGLEIDTPNQTEELLISMHPDGIDPKSPFIGTIAGLKEPHYIFANSYEEAGTLFAGWCEDRGAFDAMRHALEDPNSPIPPFIVRHMDTFPHYLAVARRNLSEVKDVNPV